MKETLVQGSLFDSFLKLNKTSELYYRFRFLLDVFIFQILNILRCELFKFFLTNLF